MLSEARQAAAMRDMDSMLVSAIEQRRRLRLFYNGKIRVVEPPCYGIGARKTELLRAHQLQRWARA